MSLTEGLSCQGRGSRFLGRKYCRGHAPVSWHHVMALLCLLAGGVDLDPVVKLVSASVHHYKDTAFPFSMLYFLEPSNQVQIKSLTIRQWK